MLPTDAGVISELLRISMSGNSLNCIYMILHMLHKSTYIRDNFFFQSRDASAMLKVLEFPEIAYQIFSFSAITRHAPDQFENQFEQSEPV